MVKNETKIEGCLHIGGMSAFCLVAAGCSKQTFCGTTEGGKNPQPSLAVWQLHREPMEATAIRRCEARAQHLPASLMFDTPIDRVFWKGSEQDRRANRLWGVFPIREPFKNPGFTKSCVEAMVVETEIRYRAKFRWRQSFVFIGYDGYDLWVLHTPTSNVLKFCRGSTDSTVGDVNISASNECEPKS